MKRIGRVKWFNETKEYRFIEQIVDRDVFVHYSAIRMEGYRALREEKEVEFEALVTPKGLQVSEVCFRSRRPFRRELPGRGC